MFSNKLSVVFLQERIIERRKAELHLSHHSIEQHVKYMCVDKLVSFQFTITFSFAKTLCCLSTNFTKLEDKFVYSCFFLFLCNLVVQGRCL